MIKTINIKNKRAEKQINQVKEKKNTNVDIRFENVRLLKINDLCRKNIFCKNDLFANAEMLWEIMQPVGTQDI